MKVVANTPDEYVDALPAERREPVQHLRQVLRANLPPEVEERISYGMIAFVIPHRIYPPGYHAKPEEPVPLMSIAAQKNHYALYHMGMYLQPDLHDWLTGEYARRGLGRPDFGKGCIRFRRPESIPYDLVAEMCSQVVLTRFLERYREQASGARQRRRGSRRSGTAKLAGLPKVAFVCVHNSCRSQIAEALGRHLAGDVFVSYSAGTELADRINPDAVRLVKRLYGIDMEATQGPKLLGELPAVDVVVKMGCEVACPFVPGRHVEDWGLVDPSGQGDEAFLAVIRAIDERVRDLARRIRLGAVPIERGAEDDST